MKKLLATIICITILTSSVNSVFIPVEIEQLENKIVYINKDNKNNSLHELLDLINSCENNMNIAHEMAECARKLGYFEDDYIIQSAKSDWEVYNKLRLTYLDDYAVKKYEKEVHEFPAATKVWYYLLDKGFNEYVIAGIIGNMMVECGGFTLNLNPVIFDPTKTYYGLCQWSKEYCYNVFYCDIYEQLDYLINTIEYEINTFGYCYYNGFTYKDFIELQGEQTAALAFSLCYEKCNPWTNTLRQQCATDAYIYFHK